MTMTVGELIEKLSEINQDLPVFRTSSNAGFFIEYDTPYYETIMQAKDELDCYMQCKDPWNKAKVRKQFNPPFEALIL